MELETLYKKLGELALKEKSIKKEIQKVLKEIKIIEKGIKRGNYGS